MSDIGVREWLESRVPPPPAALAVILASAVGEARCSTADISSVLVAEAERLIAKLGDGRDSANDLLAADALITYGLEAAAEHPGSIEQAARRAMTSIAGIVDRDGEAG